MYKFLFVVTLVTSFTASFSQSTKPLNYLNNRTFSIETTDFSDNPQTMQFKASYDNKSKQLKLIKVEGSTANLTFRSDSNELETPLLLKRIGGDTLFFAGTLFITTDYGKKRRFNSTMAVLLDSGAQTKRVWMRCSLECDCYYDTRIWGIGKVGGVSNGLQKTIAKPATKSKQINDMASLLDYMNNKTFVSPKGTEVKIAYSSDHNTYGVFVNKKFMYFNISFSTLTKYTGIIKAEFLGYSDDPIVKFYVDSEKNFLINDKIVYSLKQ